MGDDLNKFVRMIVAIFAVFPQLVQSSATDDQGGIDLDSIGPEAGVLKEFFERLEISLETHVGEIRHHMADHLVSAIFGNSEGLLD